MLLPPSFRMAVLVVAFVAVALPLRASAAVAGIDQVRLSWQRDPKTTMTIMWRTPVAFDGLPRVQYGSTSAYGADASGTSQPAVLDGYAYHAVEIIGLTPNTTYHYRVRGPSGVWGDDATFRTAPNGAADFAFTVFGDNGMAGNNGSRAVTMKDRIAGQLPAFHLIAGDLSYADGDRCDGQPCVREHWEGWLSEMERISRSIPVMAAIGNHEVKDDMQLPGGEFFFTRSLALPGSSERVYSFDYGDAHIIALDSNDWRGLRRGGAQYAWLESDLAATSKRWKIVFFHHLAYTSGGEHDDIEAIQQETTPLFDRYGVDLVLQAHNHHYERTFPLRYRAKDDPEIVTMERTEYVRPGAPIYLTTGGGGAGIYEFPSNPKPWSVARCECHEFVRVDVDDVGTLTVTAIGLDGSTVDRFRIVKTAGAPPPLVSSTPPAPPTPVTPSTPLTPSIPSLQTIRGFNMGGWWHDSFGSADARRSLDRLAATGANEVALAPFWYQDLKTSTQIYRRDEKSPTDESVRAAVRYAKSKGLRVAFKPMVDSRDGTWRGQLVPSDRAAWFESYRQFLLTFARIAAEEQVDRLIIGTELASLTRATDTPRWRALIAEIRTIYRGPLTYAANWGEKNEGEYYQVEFWDALDAIGIDAYFPLSSADRPTVSDVEAGWRSTTKGGREVRWFDDIRQLHERFGKPVIFTEIGFLSCERAGEKPWEYPCRRTVAPAVQANLYEGTLRFWAGVDWMLGFHFWRWDTNPDAGGATNGDYVPQGKPTEEMLRRYWTVAASASSGGASASNAVTIPATSSVPSTGNAVFGNAPSGGAASASGSGTRSAPGNVFTAPPASSNSNGARALVKLACPAGVRGDHVCRTVYWHGADGQRYAFPNESVYRTWFADFSGVRIVTRGQLAAIPLGGLVTHRPGVRLVKLPYASKVYAVDRGATLRWVVTEADARTIAGTAWGRMIDDLPEWLFGYYRIGTATGTAPLFRADDVRRAASDLDVEIRDTLAAR
ncbi:MAG: fibronectin type III domain-containing protein [bacterium]|nr:fibronectin type III domain-containing protein [bacterium]